MFAADPFSRPRALGADRSTIQKAGTQPDAAQYQWLHDLADASAPAVRRAFLAAVEKLKGSVKIGELADALERGNMDEVMRLLAIDTQMPAEMRAALQTTLEDAFVAAGRAAVTETLPTDIQLAMRFDLTNPNAVEFLRSYEFGLIRQVTQDTRDAVRSVVLRAFEEGGHPREQARAIRDIIGLTDRQQAAVANYRASLVEAGYDTDKIAGMVERYQQKLLRLRATNIARTETLRAANAGQNAAWQQAADTQLLNRVTARQYWLVTPDDRLCPYCAVVPIMNEGGVPLGGYFLTLLGPVEYPPLHPQCRCVLTIEEP